MKIRLKKKCFPLFWLGASGVTIGKVIYVREDVWNRMDMRRRAGFLAHEAVHVRQEEEVGVIKFLWKYITSKTYRFQVEVEAYAVEAQSLIDQGMKREIVLAVCAKSLSSSMYGVGSYTKALAAITEFMGNT